MRGCCFPAGCRRTKSIQCARLSTRFCKQNGTCGELTHKAGTHLGLSPPGFCSLLADEGRTRLHAYAALQVPRASSERGREGGRGHEEREYPLSAPCPVRHSWCSVVVRNLSAGRSAASQACTMVHMLGQLSGPSWQVALRVISVMLFMMTCCKCRCQGGSQARPPQSAAGYHLSRAGISVRCSRYITILLDCGTRSAVRTSVRISVFCLSVLSIGLF